MIGLPKGKELPFGDYYAVRPKRRCKECDAPEVVTFRVSAEGWSSGDTKTHTETCSSVTCCHGVHFNRGCKKCEAKDQCSEED